MVTLTNAERKSLATTAATVGTTPEALYRLILAESNWDPQAKNPTSSARGLIQFIDSTAQDLGFESSADLVEMFPDRISQLEGPITTYLVQYGPFANEQELFMAVFYPAARTWPPDREFPQWVQDANAGISTPAEYVQFVRDKQDVSDFQIAAMVRPWAGVLLIAGAAVALWYFTQT